MRDQRIAPRDPIPQREALYILVDKPVGGGGSDAESNRFPVFLNDERLVTFAKIVGGVQDEKILEMLRTAKGFRRLVHSIGVSIVSDVPDKVAAFRMVFFGGTRHRRRQRQDFSAYQWRRNHHGNGFRRGTRYGRCSRQVLDRTPL